MKFKKQHTPVIRSALCCGNTHLAAWSPKEPIKMAKAFTWGLLVRIWAKRAGFIPYRDRFASLNMMTKYSSASSVVMSLMACSVPSSVWSPLMQNWEWACIVWGKSWAQKPQVSNSSWWSVYWQTTCLLITYWRQHGTRTVLWGWLSLDTGIAPKCPQLTLLQLNILFKVRKYVTGIIWKRGTVQENKKGWAEFPVHKLIRC